MCSKVNDFLTDNSFIHYVLEETSDAVSQWETYLNTHPEYVESMETAKEILLTSDGAVCDFSIEEYLILKDRIISSIKDFQRIE